MGAWILMVVVVTCGLFCGHSEGCSCMRTHLQDAYCTSDYAIRATVRDVEILYMSYEVDQNGTISNYSQPVDRKYTIKVRRVLKRTEAFDNATQTEVYTSYMENLCGTRLEVGQQYLLMGRISNTALIINLCNAPTVWTDLTDYQRKGVSYMYKRHCNDCHIAPCYGEMCEHIRRSPNRDICILDWADDWMSGCMVQHGQCKLTGEGGYCQWSPRRAILEQQCLQNRLP